MSAPALCPGCARGNHGDHLELWQQPIEGVIDGTHCPCAGGCVPPPDLASLLRAPADLEGPDVVGPMVRRRMATPAPVKYVDFDPEDPSLLATSARHVHVRWTERCLRNETGAPCLTPDELRAEVERLEALLSTVAANLAADVMLAEHRAKRAEAERGALQQQVDEVRVMADEWEREYGRESEAHRVFGPQVLTIPFAVETIRAALDAVEPADQRVWLCSQCGEMPSAMVKIGTSDGWCVTCLDLAVEPAGQPHADDEDVVPAQVVTPESCPNHRPRQHRDGKPPWCELCRRTADGRIPVSVLDHEAGLAFETGGYVADSSAPWARCRKTEPHAPHWVTAGKGPHAFIGGQCMGHGSVETNDGSTR